MTFSQMIGNLVGPGRKMTRASWNKEHYIYYGFKPTDKTKQYPVIIEHINDKPYNIYKPSRADLSALDWEIL